MQGKSDPPKTYQDFISRYPKLGEAWEKIAEAGQSGPLDEQTVRLADRSYLSEVHGDFTGDVHFQFDRGDWREESREQKTGFDFITYVRNK